MLPGVLPSTPNGFLLILWTICALQAYEAPNLRSHYSNSYKKNKNIRWVGQHWALFTAIITIRARSLHYDYDFTQKK